MRYVLTALAIVAGAVSLYRAQARADDLGRLNPTQFQEEQAMKRRSAAPGQEIPTSPHTRTIIDSVGCTTCHAEPGEYCSEQEKHLPELRYVCAPHQARVKLAGFRIVRHPIDDGVRWYEAVTE